MRSHYCGTLNLSSDKQQVTLCGWVHRRRDHGGVIFLDMRDITGIIQVVAAPETKEAFQHADCVRSEYVLSIEGYIRPRPEGTVNKEMSTGGIEVVAHKVTILSKAQTPPIQIEGYTEVGENVRLKHRVIDLRRAEMQKNIITRSKIMSYIRNFLNQHNFLDIETPMLTRSTPEGARDYLVASRIHEAHFYALPQSPQLFKQLLMIAGFDRYYQITRCFRDEDLRADRQPEFTQIDIETSFMDQRSIMKLTETMIQDLFQQINSIELTSEFPQLTYKEAMRRFGSDKPDLRIPLELVDIADLVATIDFNVFKKPANDESSRVVALKVTGGAKLSRKQIDDYTKFVGIYGARGLAWIKVNNLDQGIDGLQSPIIKFLGEQATLDIIARVDAKNNDIIFFGADKFQIVNDALGALRNKLGADLNLYTCEWAPLWITEFPMFLDTGDGTLTTLHHPFTSPRCSEADLEAEPLAAYTCAYDMVINGYEVGGGSIRINQTSMQQLVFKLLNIDKDEQQEKFGFLLEALTHGAPPHGGIAFGLDRIAMLLCGTSNIRDVIAFPKTQSASCLLTEAPSAITHKQLSELHLKIDSPTTRN